MTIKILLALILTTALVQARQMVVILPERFQNNPVVVENSPQYQELIAKVTGLNAQIEAEKNTFAEFQTKADKERTEKAEELKKLTLEVAKLKANRRTFRLIVAGIGLAGLLYLAIRLKLWRLLL